MASVLDKTHLKTINETLRKLHDVQDLISKCRACNLDVAQFEDDRLYLVSQLEAVKREFFGAAGG